MKNLLTAVRFRQRISDFAIIITLEFGDHTEVSIPMTDGAIRMAEIDPTKIRISLEEVS